MTVFEIPGMLFSECCERFGKDSKETMITGCGLSYKVVELTEPIGGAIGLRLPNDDNVAEFVVWSNIPESGEDIIRSRLLEIFAMSTDAGVWAYGSGRMMSEKLLAQFPFRSINLRNSVIAVAAFVFGRASELALLPELEQKTFWEREVAPERDYTSPDDDD